jgi:hypothetical protein
MDDRRMTVGVVVPAHGNSTGHPVEVALVNEPLYSRRKLQRERDELLAALRRLISARKDFDWSNDAGWSDAEALIARIEAP